MYKIGGGRGGGGGGRGGAAAKRPPAPHGRGRGGIGGGGGMAGPPRGRGGAAAAAAAAQVGRDEAFRLESGGPPNFAAIIRLTPDLVDEIRRAEAAGGGARIKFNANMYNSSENVIDVGGKEFKFTWASERGELCDIYEERQSGEEGNGLLLECGSAWRKVNVQRILDESAKNLVKMRSEEAERLSKSRKAIVLDPANPSVKSQAKSMAAAAVEGNMRRMHWKQKKEFFKKNQAAVIAPTKSVSKVKLSNNVAKGSFATSPVPSPEQPGPSVSSFPLGTDSNNEVITPFDLNKEENSKVEKETPSRVSQGVNRRPSALSASLDDITADLRSLLISILSENPKGMSLKALEKAVGDAIPNASKKIETIIKNIATFQAPGRYLLKPGLEVESSKKRASDGGSSLENAPYQTSIDVSNRVINENIEEAVPSLKVDESDTFERIDIGGSPSSFLGEAKVNNDNDVKADSSSESGSDSDSDSDSSDSGSDSGSQSRSLAESGSGSSSDSDSDASSSNKEASDVVVDITSDDDKEDTAQKKVADGLKLSSSPRDLRTMEDDDEHIDIGTNLEHENASPLIDLNDFEKGDDEAAYTAAATENFSASNRDKSSEISESKNLRNTRMDSDRVDRRYSGNEMPYPVDQDNFLDDHLALNNESLVKEETGQFVKQNVNKKKATFKDGSNHDLSMITEKGTKPKLKRSSGTENSSEKPESAKRAKADMASSGKAKGASFSENTQNLPADKLMNDRLNKEAQNADWDVHMDLNALDSSPAMNGRSVASGNLQKINQSPNIGSIPTLHSEKAQQKIEKSSGKKKAADKVQRPWNSMDNNFGRGSAHSEGLPVNFDDADDSATRKRSRHREPFVDEKTLKRVKDVNSDLNSMNLTKNARGNAGADKIMSFTESYESNGQPSNVQRNNVEKSPFSGKKVLQRELSDLELGEFREPSLDYDLGRTRKQFERNNSSKSLDTKLTNADNSYPSISNRKTAIFAFLEHKKPSPQNFGVGSHINQEGFHRKAPADDFMDTNRPQQRANLSQSRQLSRTDNPDSETILYLDRSAEMTGRKETRTTQGVMLDHADSNKKKPAARLPQNGSKNILESKMWKSSSPAENEERSRSNFMIENETSGRKRRDSSSDEDNFFYSKYDKDEPELKGPIKDFSQYKEYVKEYNEKYEAYCNLNSQLEKTRDEFLKVGHDLDIAKGRDIEQYYSIVDKLRDMYHESGVRHKLMKKVFLLLHEELKTMKQRIKDFAEVYTKE